MKERRGLGVIATAAALLLGAPYGLAQASEPVTLGANGSAELQGVTTGSDSLTQMASRDRRRKLCLGYASSDPNHVVVLTGKRASLRVAVDSSGEDTTLFIQGPEGIYCNDNASRANRDAAVTARGWPEGTYRIWVGAFNKGDQLNYTLSIYEPSARQRPR